MAPKLSKTILSAAGITALLVLLLFMSRRLIPVQVLFSSFEKPTPAAHETVAQSAGESANRLSPTGALWRRLEVMPVFFIPSDEQPPSEQQVQLLRKHLELARERYRVMLKNRDTFALSDKTVLYRSKNPLDFFRDKKDRLGDFLTVEVLDYFQVDRHTCPYVFVIVLMSPHDNVPAGGGIPINAGYNTGGGVLEVASYRLDTGDSFQNTLEHELGHAFGLPHVGEAYGYDMETSRSIMSYNPHNHWKGFTPPEEPSTLIPEDLKAISYNKRGFPDFTFDPQTDIPAGYPMVNTVIALYPPVQLPGHPSYEVKVSSECPTEDGSLKNVVPKFIEAPQSTKIENLWVSGEAPEDGWIKIMVQFPEATTLTSIVIHSQQGGSINRVEALRIEYGETNGFKKITEQKVEMPDVLIQFTQATAQEWRLSLKPGASKKVTARGVEFFNGDTQLYPPLYPYKLWHKTVVGN